MTAALPFETAPAAMPPEVLDFLRQLSVGLNRCRAYPPGHPTLERTMVSLQEQLEGLLENRERLTIGVTRTHLIVDDTATDPAVQLYADLADRFFRRQVGAVVFSRGVKIDNLRTALRVLSREVRGRDDVNPEEFSDPGLGDGVAFVPFDFSPLGIADGEIASPAEAPTHLLNSLARVLITGGLSAGMATDGEEVTPEAVAAAINAQAEQRTFDPVMGAEFLRYAKSVREAGGAESLGLRRQLRSLVGGLTPTALAAILTADGSPAARRRVMASAVDALPAELVLEMIRSAATAQEHGMSQSLLRLLRKLSVQADGPGADEPRAEADRLLRETIRGLIDDWTLPDPNPAGHTRILRNLSSNPLFRDVDGETLENDAVRLLQTAFETEAAGELVWEAVEDGVRDRQLAVIVQLTEAYPADHPTTVAVRQHLVTPTVLGLMLGGAEVEVEALRAIIPNVPAVSADALLDALVTHEAPEIRQLLLARLRALSSQIGPLVVARLGTAPVDLLRHLLAIVRELPALPAGFDARVFARHGDPLIRREALRIMLRDPETADEAIGTALVDPDDRILRFGLMRMTGAPPRAVVPRLLRRLSQAGGDDTLKAEAIRRLGTLRTSTIRDWMLERVMVRKGFWRQARLAPMTPPILASLETLARFWRDDPRCQAVFELMRRSDDPAVRAALSLEATP